MLQSIDHALRVLRKDPAFTAVAISSLALGIGVTSSMFSFADEMLLRPLPVRNPDRVVTINTAAFAPFGSNPPISYPDYADLRERNRTFDGLVAASYAFVGFSPDAATQPRMKFGLYVSGNFFRVLGIEPALGRGFRPDEDQVEGRDAVVILGHDFWVGQFGADPAAVGSRIRLSGVEFLVIGVAPERFTGIDTVFRPQMFVPMAMSPLLNRRDCLHDRDFGWLFIKGRLKPRVSLDRAQADIEAIAAGFRNLHSPAGRDQRLRVETEFQFRISQGPEQMAFVAMLVLLGICVLLVACANVAGLLLSRARARSHEIAVRLAIGAGRGTLIRQLLLENLIMAIAGGAAGLLVADVSADFWRRNPIRSDLPVVFDVQVDHRVLLFTLVVSVVSTLLFGLVPALRASRPDLVPALKGTDGETGSRRRLWGRGALVAGQVAVSLVLLTISASMVQGFREQFAQGPGYRTDRLFVATLDAQMAHYSEDQTSRYYRDLLDATRQAAGVKSAALGGIPMQDAALSVGIIPEGWQLQPNEHSIATMCFYVSDGYFETMNIPILQGRDFRRSDGAGAPLVAVVNEQAARHFWKGDALGKRFHLGAATAPLVEIVGIARMSKYQWIAEGTMDFVYLPFQQHPRSKISLLAESAAPDAASLAPGLRDVLRRLDPEMPVFDARPMQELYNERANKLPNMVVQVVGGMGLTGMILAAVGLYGLVAYSVSRRTREIGIRMALGASQGSVVRMVLRQGLRLGVAGVAVGMAGAYFAWRAIIYSIGLFNFRRVDPLIFIAIPLTLLLITVLASWAPARRAARVDPLTSLRDQ
jgi:predicted permease